MNRFSASMAVTLVSAVAISGVATGCSSSHDEAVETREQANELYDASGLISRGQKNVENGKALVARGEEMQKNNDQKVAGEDMVAEGNAQINYGETQIKEGEDLKAKAK